MSVVREVAVADGETVCLITAPSGSRHWVAQEALSRVGRPIAARAGTAERRALGQGALLALGRAEC